MVDTFKTEFLQVPENQSALQIVENRARICHIKIGTKHRNGKPVCSTNCREQSKDLSYKNRNKAQKWKKKLKKNSDWIL